MRVLRNLFFNLTSNFLPLTSISSLSIFHFLLSTSYLYSQSGWGPDVRLTFDYAYNASPRADCCGDTIHLVWWKNYVDSLSNMHEEVFYKRSTDAGLTWGEDVRLTPEDAVSATLPTIAVWGNNIHIVWKETYVYYYAICYRKSTDGGNTWGMIDTLHKTNMYGMMGYPKLCVFRDTVFLVMTRDDGNLLFSRSTNNGLSWEPARVIGDGAAHPSLKIFKSSSLGLVTTVDASEVIEILFYRSTDAGVSWTDSQIVSEPDGAGSQHPAMDTDDSGGIHITWYDYKYSPYPWTGDIFYRASRDSGNTWEEIDSLTVMHRAVASDILAEGNNLHLVWEDDRNDFGNNFEIYYRMSTDLGRNWLPEERLTYAPYKSIGPSLAYGGGYLHLFWSDLRDYGNNQPWMLYYKRKNLDVDIGELPRLKLEHPYLSLNCPTILTKGCLIQYDLGSKKEGDLSLIDVTGRVIWRFPVHQGSGKIILNINKEVQNGVYFLMLKATKDYLVRKVLVMR